MLSMKRVIHKGSGLQSYTDLCGELFIDGTDHRGVADIHCRIFTS